MTIADPGHLSRGLFGRAADIPSRIVLGFLVEQTPHLLATDRCFREPSELSPLGRVQRAQGPLSGGPPWCEGSAPFKLNPETDFVHFDHVFGALLLIFQCMTMEGCVALGGMLSGSFGVPAYAGRGGQLGWRAGSAEWCQIGAGFAARQMGNS